MDEKCKRITHEDCLEQKRDQEQQADSERKRSREQLDKERPVKQCEIHNDENIRLFLKSMRNEDVVQGSVLRLPADVSLGGRCHLGHLGGKLLVRTCYKNVCALLFEECKIGQVEEEDSARISRFVITGNPGIGKSLFSYYLLYRLMQEKVTVVWEPYNTHSRVLITPDAIRFGDVKTGFGRQLSSSSTWYIVDTMEPANVNANIVLVSWPKKEVIKTFQKTAVTLCMPVWSRAEVDLAAQLGLANTMSDGLPVTAERIDRLFHLCGGIPRYVFERQELEMEDLEGRLKLAAEHTAKCLIDGTIDMHSYRSYPAPASYWMVKIVPPTQDGPKRYRGFNVEFTSTRVEEIVAKSVNALQEADRLNFLNRCKELDSFAAFAGNMVDNYGRDIRRDKKFEN